MFVMVLVGLYTSRVILNALGEDDFGIYGAVGGVVALFGILTGSLANSVSRFISYELGKEDHQVDTVFSTTVIVQWAMAAIIFVLAEVLGTWFLNAKMVIPDGRMATANWVLQCSILCFVVNMMAVPYNAAIIAHEKMEAFAYISIAEAVLSLGAALIVRFSGADRLKLYAILMLAVALAVRLLYTCYARRHFEECRSRKRKLDKDVARQIGSYASWTLLGNGASVINSQGINVLMNLFFGVRVNAARDVTVKLEGNVSRFIFNITTAINPQINKSCAANRYDYLHELVCKGAKYSYLLFYFFALPLILETPALLKLWLNIVPEYAVIFVRISLVSSLLVSVGHPFSSAIFATGDVKRYQIVVAITSLIAFPLSYVAYRLGYPPQCAYWILVGTSLLVLVERVAFACRQVKLPFGMVVKDVLLRVVLVSVLSAIIPLAIHFLQDASLWRALEVVLSSFLLVAVFSYFFGATSGEQRMVLETLKKYTSLLRPSKKR